jgi:hypothetical protein
VSARLREAITLTHQCWLFAIGSSLFATATAPGFAELAGALAANALCFVGSWFFTTAAWIQLVRSGPEGSAEWFSAATQFAGTVLFNVSTGAAVWAHAVLAERRLVWAPDAIGSFAFLFSGALGIVAVSTQVGPWMPKSREWQAQWVNMIGCAAFGVSAVGAFVRMSGITSNEALASLGTFIGAICFLVAALLILPRFQARAARGSRSP